MHLKKTMKERRNLNVLKNVAALARKTRNVKKQIRKVNARKKHNHAKTRINKGNVNGRMKATNPRNAKMFKTTRVRRNATANAKKGKPNRPFPSQVPLQLPPGPCNL